MGAIHLRMKRPDLAAAALDEGLKMSRESWRMWENKLLAVLQVGHFLRVTFYVTTY